MGLLQLRLVYTRFYSSNKLSKLYTTNKLCQPQIKTEIVMNYNSEHNNLEWAHVPQRMYTNALQNWPHPLHNSGQFSLKTE